MLLQGLLSLGAWGTPAVPMCVLVPAAFPTLLRGGRLVERTIS